MSSANSVDVVTIGRPWEDALLWSTLSADLLVLIVCRIYTFAYISIQRSVWKLRDYTGGNSRASTHRLDCMQTACYRDNAARAGTRSIDCKVADITNTLSMHAFTDTTTDQRILINVIDAVFLDARTLKDPCDVAKRYFGSVVCAATPPFRKGGSSLAKASTESSAHLWLSKSRVHIDALPRDTLLSCAHSEKAFGTSTSKPLLLRFVHAAGQSVSSAVHVIAKTILVNASLIEQREWP